MRKWCAASTLLLFVLLLVVAGPLFVSNGPGTLFGARSCCEGDVWLSWSQEAKETYVRGFREGFERGVYNACDAGAGSRDSGSGGDRGAVCRKQAGDLAETDDRFYTDAITRFYENYRADRWLFMREILMDMAQPPGLSIDQIHAQINKRHHP